MSVGRAILKSAGGPADTAGGPTRPRGATSRGRGCVHHILIVEDSPTMRSLVVSALEDIGLPVRITEARAASRRCASCRAATTT